MQGVIQVRRPQLKLDAAIPRHWHDGGPLTTHFLNSLSTLFPEGEAFFVRAVLHYREAIDDPTLREAIRSFAGQEGQHSHHHDRHVELLITQGYGFFERRNRMMGRVLRFVNERRPAWSLAMTAALEHLTALLARQLMSHPERWTAPMDLPMRSLWEWHAVEEAEHKAVAFDVLMRVAPSRRRRVAAMLVATLGLALETLLGVSYMLGVDGKLFSWRTWSEGARCLFGREGLLRGTGRDYLRWYRRDFHPDQLDDGPLLDDWRGRIAPATS